jgi:uncharacterized protein YbaR (Trm112 family)
MTERIIAPATQPELRTVLDQLKRQTMLAINCVQIGTILEYKAITNTAKVKINFQMLMGNGEIVEYPILDDCPVFTLSGGDSFVSCPIAENDNCIVLFNDRSIDNWYLRGDVTTPSDKRAHSIADGIVLVGINPINAPKATLSNRICINGGTSKIVIKNKDEDLKTLLASLNTTIKSTIDTIKEMNTEIGALIDLIGAIQVITTTATLGVPATSAIPINASTILGEKTKFTGYNTTLDSRKTDLTTLSTDMAKLLDEGAI